MRKCREISELLSMAEDKRLSVLDRLGLRMHAAECGRAERQCHGRKRGDVRHAQPLRCRNQAIGIALCSVLSGVMAQLSISS